VTLDGEIFGVDRRGTMGNGIAQVRRAQGSMS
jgi:hypothetical protein